MRNIDKRFFSRIYDHYFDPDAERVEVSEFRDALQRFFRSKDNLGEERLALFNEWLLFDQPMRSPDGVRETLLARWIRENPFRIGSMQMRLYRAVANDNKYGWFEIVAVEVDHGLTLKCLADDTVYDVLEKGGTHGVAVGMVVISRVGKYDDHYELVGSDGTLVPTAPKGRDLKQFKAQWKREPWTPLHTEHLLRSEDVSLAEEAHDVVEHEMRWYADHPDEVDEVVARALRNCSLERFVSVSAVRTWAQRAIEESEHEGADRSAIMSAPARILFGLLPHTAKQDDRVEVLRAYSLLVNSMVRHKLDRLTPYERHKLRSNMAEEDSVMEFAYSTEWDRHMHRGIQYMKHGKHHEACNEFEQVFAFLLREQTTFFELYSVYANCGIAYVMAGKTALGMFLLEYACAINPNYPFARDMLVHLKKTIPIEVWGVELHDAVYNKNMSLQYRTWITKWGIDFSTEKPVRARRATVPVKKKRP